MSASDTHNPTRKRASAPKHCKITKIYSILHGDGVHDVRLSRKTAYSSMCLTGKVEGLGDDVHLLAVATLAIGVQQSLERLVHHAFFFLFPDVLLVVHLK